MIFASVEVIFAEIEVTFTRNVHSNPTVIPDRMKKAGTSTGFNAFKMLILL